MMHLSCPGMALFTRGYLPMLHPLYKYQDALHQFTPLFFPSTVPPPHRRRLAAMETTPAHTLNLCGVLLEAKRIVNAHSRHFLALSLLFLLPLSFSLIIFPTLQLSLAQYDVVITQFFIIHPPPQTLTLPLLYTLFVYIFFLGAVATITYSTYHGFYGRPVRFFPAIKSLAVSFLPLVSTTIAAQLLLGLISLTFLLFFVVIIKTAENLGFEIDYDSNCFIVFCAFVAVVLVLVVIYFQVNWSLAFVIVVAESKWGFEPLWRSSNLVKGMRSISLSLLLFFGVLIGFWVWMNSNNVLHLDAVGGWRSWPFVLQMVIGTSLLTLLLLHNTAASTVFYMYCKALHGELAIEIAEEFAREYICLPFDDEKVPHVVTVIST